jgi:adenosylhomocysteine nucleosidase
MICYAFPLAHEAAPMLKACRQKESFSIDGLHCTLGNFRDQPVLVARVGMGEMQARANTELLADHFSPDALVLAGYGGALIPALNIGDVMVSTNYSSADVLSFFRLLSGFNFARFCTASEVIGTPAERDRYARTRQAEVIEMETAAVAQIAESRGIPFVALRVISDDHAHLLPVRALAAGFNAEKGRPTPLRLLAHLALHPGEIAPFSRFVGNLSLARKSLFSFLVQVNAELPGAL